MFLVLFFRHPFFFHYCTRVSEIFARKNVVVVFFLAKCVYAVYAFMRLKRLG